MKKKRILFIVGSLGGGGAEKFTINLLHELDHTKYDIHLCILKGHGIFESLLPRDITIHRLYKSKVFKALIGANKLVRYVKPDIIFSNMFHVNILAVLTIYLNYGMTVTLLIRESTIPSYRIKKDLVGQVHNKILKIIYGARMITRVVSQCEAMKSDLVTNYNISNSKILVINNPININDLLKRSKLPPDYHIDKNYINMISIGRLERVKGYDRMIEIFSRLERNKYRLHIFGEGSQRPILQKMIIERGLQDEIIIPGFLINPHAMLTQMQVFLLSSRSDSFPNVILESLALGIPVIAYNCPGGINEIIDSGNNGYLVNDGDRTGYINTIERMDYRLFNNAKIIDEAKIKYGPEVIQQYEDLFDHDYSLEMI